MKVQPSRLLSPDATPREKMRLHAVRRLWQRRGVALSDAQYEALCAGIRAGLYHVSCSGADGSVVYRLIIQEKTVFAVWRSDFDAIVTFLPAKEWIGRNHRGELRQRAQALFTEARA